MITPFHPDGSVNYGVAEKLAAHLADHGTDTVVVCGTTGESPTLTWAEEEELFKVIQRAVAGRAQVMAGTGSNSTQEAIEATRSAAKLGLAGSLQVVPYYNKPSQEGLYQHFRTIAEACPDLPIMLYNVPGRTSCNLLPETVARLAELDNIVAIKEASGNLDQASAVRQLVPSNFGLYSGDDSLTLPVLAVGGQGVVSVASHLVGDRLQTLIRAFEQGQTQSALQEHLALFDLFKTLFISTNPVPIKTALALQGWEVGNLRLPLVAMPEHQVETLRSVMQTLGLLSVSGKA